MNSKTFCVLPWIHQMVNTDGSIKYCCTASGIVKENPKSLKEEWNNSSMKKIRLDFLNGRKHEQCTTCYTEERYGRNSHRINSNKTWEKYFDFERAKRDTNEDGSISTYPLHLDLRFGNLCNLSCKMCCPNSSTSIDKDFSKIKKIDSVAYNKLWGNTLNLKLDWYKNKDIMNELISYIPHVRKIYLTGGEPTLIPENIEYLQMCIDGGYSENIILQFNSNLTNVNTKLISMFSQFKKIRFGCSIDGTKSVQEYIRAPSNWNKIRNNFIRLYNELSPGKCSFSVNLTVQLLNSIYLTECFTDLIELYQSLDTNRHKFIINTMILHRPIYYAIQNMSPNIKAYTIGKLIMWKQQHPDWGKYFRDGWKKYDSIITQLRGEPTSSISMRDNLQRFYFLDKTKKIKFADALPELYTLMTDG